MIRRTLSELAELCEATLVGEGTRTVTGPAGLVEATPEEVSFLAHPRYRDQLETTRAAAVLVGKEVEVRRGDLALLRCADPQRSFTRVVLAFRPEEMLAPAGVHPSAVVDASAELAPDVSVGPLCWIGPRARLARGVRLVAQVAVGAGASVGEGSVLHPGVVLYAGVEVGARCILHGGAVLGADGFGYEPGAAGWEKIPQCGTVVLEEDVEVGANATIDRARFGSTRLGRGVKIDNLVHVGHNVQLGEGALLVAQSGIAGSTRVGRRAILAGQAGVAGHLDLGDGARVGGGSAVFRDVAAGEDVFGVPATRKSEQLRGLVHQRRLAGMLRELRELRSRLARLEEERR